MSKKEVEKVKVEIMCPYCSGVFAEWCTKSFRAITTCDGCRKDFAIDVTVKAECKTFKIDFNKENRDE